MGLAPATSDQFRNELTACLALVVPVGMTEESRREWLSVAWETLKHLPADILSSGCKAAREQCDHPSKIVPVIIAATKDWMETRRYLVTVPARSTAPRIEAPKDDRPVTVAELLAMPADIVRIARRNNLAEPETFAEFDRIVAERQAAAPQ